MKHLTMAGSLSYDFASIIISLRSSGVGLGSFIVPDFWVTLILATAKPLKCQHCRVLDLIRFFPFQLYPLLELSECALALLHLGSMLPHQGAVKLI